MSSQIWSVFIEKECYPRQREVFTDSSVIGLEQVWITAAQSPASWLFFSAPCSRSFSLISHQGGSWVSGNHIDAKFLETTSVTRRSMCIYIYSPLSLKRFHAHSPCKAQSVPNLCNLLQWLPSWPPFPFSLPVPLL